MFILVGRQAINKKILLGVSGGIAAYKAAELLRLLTKQGAEVRVVMTASAQQFVTPLTFQALSGHTVYTELSEADQTQAMEHIHLSRWADLIIIAPATANIIAKLAHGIADDMLSTLCLASECPIYIAPAMNQAMWHHPATQANIKQIEKYGISTIGPEAGVQACGELGFGRMSEPELICNTLMQPTPNKILQGVKVLISAGPTREAIDPVRFISNRSSGKMGYALAEAAAKAGAKVSLVSGPVNLTAPKAVKLIPVESALDMYEAVMTEVTDSAIYIGAAAVADYRPKIVAEQKIKKDKQSHSISLTKNVDIISEVCKLPNKPFTVGFAAETDNLEAYALNKLQQKKLDMIAANWVGGDEGGFDGDKNALQVYWRDGQQNLPMTDKTELAEQLMRLIAQRYGEIGHDPI